MKQRPLLFTAEPEALGGNGPTAAVPANIIPLAEAAQAAETPVAPVAVAAPTLLQQIQGSIQSKGALISERDAATLRATTAESQLAQANAELATLRAENATFKTERADITAALTAVQAEVKGEELAAAAQVAALGFEANKLPAADSAPEETREQLVARLEKSTDANERWNLSARVNAMD